MACDSHVECEACAQLCVWCVSAASCRFPTIDVHPCGEARDAITQADMCPPLEPVTPVKPDDTLSLGTGVAYFLPILVVGVLLCGSACACALFFCLAKVSSCALLRFF